MDLLLLLGQIALVVLLVVTPLFSGIDKWTQWSWTRRAVALSLAVGIAVVAFGQYRRVVHLDKQNLQQALGNVGLFQGPWYARRVLVAFWEYLLTIVAGSVMLAFTVDALRKRSWARGLALSAIFVAFLTAVALIKLSSWRG